MSENEFVTVELSKKQVMYDSARVSEKNGKEYVRIIAPNGSSFFYPMASLKENQNNPNRVNFTRPVGTEITLSFSERNPNVPDTASNEEKYLNTTRVVKIEDLKEMYRMAREEYAEKSPFVNVTVPSAWGNEFTSVNTDEPKKYVSISIPIHEEIQDKTVTNYYSFVIPAESFRTSDKQEGMSYFGFPQMKKDSEEEYTVTLKRSVKQDDGSYIDIEKVMSSAELVSAINAAKEMQNEKIEIEVSEKLLRNFDSHDGKPLISVSVPVFDEKSGKDIFYNIVVPESRVSEAEIEGYKKLSISKDFEFTAKRGVLDESSGKYQDVELKLTGGDIKNAFDSSKERYAEQKANESIQNDKQQENNRSVHRHGR